MNWLDNKSTIDKILLIIGAIVFVLLFFAVTSCDIMKKSAKTKTDRTLTESTETLTKRIGDTVRYEVPRVTYKDTTIYRTNRVTGTTQVVRYNDKGMIDLVECQSGAIEELTRTNRELMEVIKDKESEKEEKFDSSFILYIMIGFMGIILILAFFAFKYISKNTAIVTKLLK